MTLTVHLAITQDGEPLHEDAVEYDEEQEGLWLTVLNWLVSAGTLAREVYYGPSPRPLPKLPREAWDKELRK